MSFNIVVPAGAVEPWIGKCIKSVLDQTVEDWRMIIVLDPQGDSSYAAALSASQNDERISVVLNKEPKLALANICFGADKIRNSEEDILVLLDGDDWLSGPTSLELVESFYEGTDTLVTHGSYQPSNGTRQAKLGPYAAGEDVRRSSWKATHLRTMKMKVWDSINQKDFLSSKGVFFESAWDLAIMMPALEIAGLDRVSFIDLDLYTYNNENPVSDFRKRPEEQGMYEEYIRNKRPYERVEFK